MKAIYSYDGKGSSYYKLNSNANIDNDKIALDLKNEKDFPYNVLRFGLPYDPFNATNENYIVGLDGMDLFPEYDGP